MKKIIFSLCITIIVFFINIKVAYLQNTTDIYGYINEKPIKLNLESNFNEAYDYFIVGEKSEDKAPFILRSAQDNVKVIKSILRAMSKLLQDHSQSDYKFYCKLEFISWLDVANTPFCQNLDEPKNCPSLVLLGTTQFPLKYSKGEAIDLTSYFEKYMKEKTSIFSSNFIKQAEYDYSINGKYVAVPLITDIRLMYFNRTTYDRVGLQYPPPFKNDTMEWTWADLVNDVNAIKNYFQSQVPPIEENPFDFYGIYDEEMKFLNIVLRSFGVQTITSNNKCGFNEDDNSLNNTKRAIKEIVTPLFSNKKHPYKDWCDFESVRSADPTHIKKIKDWLNNKIPTLEDEITIECPALVPNNRTLGLLFGNPPAMYNVKLFTKEDSDSNDAEIGIAYMPGTASFLGGSGLMISKAVDKTLQDLAWDLILILTDLNYNYLEEIGLGTGMIPPYDNLIDKFQWNNTSWNVYIHQLRNSLPIQYPQQTFAEFSNLEERHLIRNMFMDIFVRNTDIEEAIIGTSKKMNEALERKCNFTDFKPYFDNCHGNRRNITFHNNSNCHVEVPLDVVEKECPYIDVSSGKGILLLLLSLFGIIINVIYISFITAYKYADPIRKASYSFSIIIVIGSTLVFISEIVSVGSQEGWQCILKMWIFILGLSLSLGSLVVKAHRIYLIFNNKDLKPKVITDKQLYKELFGIMTIEVFCLLLWTLTNKDNFKETDYQYTIEDNYYGSNKVTTKVLFCSPTRDLVPVLSLYLFNGLLLAYGGYTSIKTWSIPQMYSETKFVACSIYMILFVVAVCIPVTHLSYENGDQKFMLSSLASYFTAFLATGVYCIPKISASIKNRKINQKRLRMKLASNSLDYSTNGQIKFMLDMTTGNNSLYNHVSQQQQQQLNKRKGRLSLVLGSNDDYVGYGLGEGEGDLGGMDGTSLGLGLNLMNQNSITTTMIGNALSDNRTNFLLDSHVFDANSINKNPHLSMLNSTELNSSLCAKRVSRYQIINNEIQCPDCGCLFEITE